MIWSDFDWNIENISSQLWKQEEELVGYYSNPGEIMAAWETTAVLMLRGGRMLDIILKLDATGYSDKLDVKHEKKIFFLPEQQEELNFHLLKQEGL